MRMTRVALWLISFTVGCTPMYPVTDGFHQTLPRQGNRAVVWGDHQAAVGMATTWLQKRGLTIVERARLQQVFNEQAIRLTHTPDDEAQVLRVGKLVGAETVVFIDTPFQKELRKSFTVNTAEAKGDEYTEYSTSVSIRGVNVGTSEVMWSGTARYPRPVGGLDDALTKLTCQALATAWGLRPPGQHEFNSQAMCQAGERSGPLKD